MKIALFGYGKMGKIIEEKAIKRGHEVVLIVNRNNFSNITIQDLKDVDVAIEFSTPSSAVSNIELCFNANVPIVIGTTGWFDNFKMVSDLCIKTNNSMFWATNFSIGVNVLFHINNTLAKIMNKYPDYKVSIEEIHHNQKIDYPSGTAITIAEGLIDNLDNKSSYKAWLEDEDTKLPNIPDNKIPLKSIRKGSVPGTHIVSYESEIDNIKISHEAYNRKGFALGAIFAAEFLINKKGVFSMNDMLSF